MSTSRIYEAVIGVAKRECRPTGEALRHLDIGAGRGDLVALLRTQMPIDSSACDFHVELFGPKGIPLKRVNLNTEPLPYPDRTFDLVTCSEVVEHLENYRALIREASRVLRPGGLLIVTTPNVLNAYSRLRYLACGFTNLFGPLPVKNGILSSTGGHISPIPYFYLAHALLDADFENVSLGIDKVQKISLLWLTFLAPLIFFGWLRFWSLEGNKHRTLTVENRADVAKHLSWPVLVGRTIVVSARRRC